MTLPVIQQLAQNAKTFMEFDSDEVITWCSNCGNFGVQNAIRRALALEGLGVQDALLCYDVGCHGNGSDKMHAYTIHGLHGRVISLAAGAKIGNKDLKVIALAGDGGTFSEGVNHLVHAIRSNYPILFIHHNNENYGLTTGQPSSTSPKGCSMNAAPEGVLLEPLNVLDFVLSLKPSWVARSFSSHVDHMAEMIRQGLNHDGFAFLEVLQTCPTYNRETPDEWYAERVKDIKDKKGYDPTDIWHARQLVQDLNEEIYLGLIYKNPQKSDFLAVQPHREKFTHPLTKEVKPVSVKGLLKDLM